MQETVEALAEAYGGVTALVAELDDDDSLAPTGCHGWAVRDLLVHLLGDAQRALVALCTPTDRPADRTRLTYWSDAPGAGDPGGHAVRAVRLLGSAWGWQPLTTTWGETAAAVVRTAAGSPADLRVETQGHVLAVADLVSTLVVEAALHHLDLVAHTGRTGPGPRALAETRAALELLAGGPLPGDDATAARRGTGRLPLDGRTLRLLG